ncbi:hypothetical protein C7475_108304 [Chitinophaga sp. S165]|nr:hypothetical protein C7475_108304 [Chitinophaga sp. S165]
MYSYKSNIKSLTQPIFILNKVMLTSIKTNGCFPLPHISSLEMILSKQIDTHAALTALK